MVTLHLLGTGAIVSDGQRTTTMLACEQPGSIILIDCGGDVLQRLLASGIPAERLDEIDALIITHQHPDHVSGFPLLAERLRARGRTRPLPIYGLKVAVAQTKRLFETFDNSDRPEFAEMFQWHEISLGLDVPVLTSDYWHITATPGIHSVPVIALRIEDWVGWGRMTYSADTQPSAAIAALASGVDLLVHEATGAGPNHSSAKEAAEVAQSAKAERLVLVHLPTADRLTTNNAITEAERVFSKVEIGEELGKYEF